SVGRAPTKESPMTSAARLFLASLLVAATACQNPEVASTNGNPDATGGSGGASTGGSGGRGGGGGGGLPPSGFGASDGGAGNGTGGGTGPKPPAEGAPSCASSAADAKPIPLDVLLLVD